MMASSQPTLSRLARIAASLLIFGLLVAGLSLAVHNAFGGNPPGYDLFIFYTAGNSLFHQHQNPYAPEVTLQIQTGLYGGPAQPGQDPMRFNYPPYALLPLRPLYGLSFDWMQAVWMSFNLLALMAALMLGFPKAPPWITLSLPFFYQFAFGLLLGNFAVLIAAVLLFCFGRLVNAEDRRPAVQISAGLLLAWATAKPQFLWLFVLFLFVFALRHRLFEFLAAFLLGILGMLGISSLWLPDWPTQWISHLLAYNGDHPVSPPLFDYLKVILPGPAVRYAAAGVVLAALAASLFFFIRWRQGRISNLLLLSWCGAVIYLVHPIGISYEQIPFLLPFTVWAIENSRKRVGGLLWASAWLLSYATFFITFSKLAPAAVDRWPYLFYLAWLVYLFLAEKKKLVSANRLTAAPAQP